MFKGKSFKMVKTWPGSCYAYNDDALGALHRCQWSTRLCPRALLATRLCAECFILGMAGYILPVAVAEIFLLFYWHKTYIIKPGDRVAGERLVS